jgi:hypothetical protein
MKSLQERDGTANRLASQVLALRRRLHRMSQSVLRSKEPKPSVASGLKIEVLRDICEQPAAISDQPHQQSFPQFMELPLEIRLLIWYFASTVGRVVELQWSRLGMGFRNCAAPRPAAVLHTCHESREEALRVFRPYFGMRGRRNPIYVDPVNDVLFFRLPPGLYVSQWMSEWMQRSKRPEREKLLREELKGIRRVAFLARDIEYNGSPFSARPVRLLPDLEELIILWADWSLRTLEGRGFNLIEGVSPHVNHVHTNVSQEIRTVKQWERQFGYRKLRSEKPVISLRHWCVREEE